MIRSLEARDAILIEAFQASRDTPDYAEIGKLVEPHLGRQQVRNRLKINGYDPPNEKPGRPRNDVQPINETFRRIGQVVREFRARHEMSLKGFANLTNIPFSTIGKVENGVHNLSLIEAISIAKIVERPLQEFVGD